MISLREECVEPLTPVFEAGCLRQGDPCRGTPGCCSCTTERSPRGFLPRFTPSSFSRRVVRRRRLKMAKNREGVG